MGGTAPAWLNAANEVAVEAFLSELIAWSQIPDVLDAVLQRHDGEVADTPDAIFRADERARATARALLTEWELRS